MTTDLSADLDSLPADVRRVLSAFGFDREWFVKEASGLLAEGRRDNHVRGEVIPPQPGDVVDLAPVGGEERSRLRALGEDALGRGECALVVLAGGMATRMGGVVKALVEALPGRTFLDLRLAEQEALEERTGRIVPLWLMTSHATDGPIREALGSRLDGYRVAVFPQRVSLRLTTEGELFRDAAGRVSAHSPGHGDLPEALQDSGLLDSFLEGGGRYVTTANLDNIGATLDPAVIGTHIARDEQVTCEVVDKVGTDKGGIPVRLDGRPIVLEEFRIPPSFDASRVRVFNTNTFHFDAAALRDLAMPWTYFVVPKQVAGQDIVQFERLVNEVASHLETVFLRVPRQVPHTRFLPIKDEDDLAEMRPDVEAVARDRGML
jgi:UTP--glucose-1-phosphate uridylyltransferase